MLYRTLLLAVVMVVALSACGGGEPETCEEIASVTVDLVQGLIDDVEKEVGTMSVEELIETQGDLPSVEGFQEEAAKIDERAIELGCTQSEIQASVVEQSGRLEADSPIGQFIIEAIRTGGL